MQTQPIFCGEAEYERWLNSALEAERQRLQLQMAPRHPRSPAPRNENIHTRKEGEEA